MIGTSPGGKHRPKKQPSERGWTSTGARRPRPSKPKGDGPYKPRGFFRRFWWLFVLVPAIAIAGFLGTIAYVYAKTPLPDLPPGPQTTYLYDVSGRLIT